MLWRGKQRAAFSLVELLFVIAIIAMLLALLVSATFKLIESQQVSNTQSVLDRVQSQLVKQWSIVKDQAYKETIPPATDQWIRTNLAGNDVNATGRVRVIYVKLKLRQVFPMNFNEALYPPSAGGGNACPGINPQPAYLAYLNQRGVFTSGGFAWESSACLLMALTIGQSGIPADTLQAGGAGSVDDAGYGIPVLMDAWKRPIYFTRVPSGCPLLNPNGAHPDSTDPQPYPVSYDPGDPQGYLQLPNWGTTYGQLFTSITQQPLAPSGHSFKLAPLVASGGPGKNQQPTFDPVSFAPRGYAEPLYSNP